MGDVYGGGGWGQFPNISSIACPKIKWFYPNMAMWKNSENTHTHTHKYIHRQQKYHLPKVTVCWIHPCCWVSQVMMLMCLHLLVFSLEGDQWVSHLECPRVHYFLHIVVSVPYISLIEGKQCLVDMFLFLHCYLPQFCGIISLTLYSASTYPLFSHSA